MERPERAARQSPPADGKQVNTLVDSILAARPHHLPKATHPWKKNATQIERFGTPAQAMFDRGISPIPAA